LMNKIKAVGIRYVDKSEQAWFKRL
jgi:hypothetical protein